MSSKGEKTFLADMSARALSPPPLGLNGHMSKNVSCFFLMYNILVFSKQNRKFSSFFPHNKSLQFLSGQGFPPALNGNFR